MAKTIFKTNCLFMLIMCVSIILVFPPIFVQLRIQAATFPITSSPVGTVITMGGQKFVKINSAGMFVALQIFQPCTPSDSNTMQCWTGCNKLAKPTGINFTQGPILIDRRDGKQYEIRKFSDGKCWMVDNLRYGGGINGVGDYCLGKTTFRNASSLANSIATTTNGLNSPSGPATLVGDCRDAAAGSTKIPCKGATACGYYYNWPAAIQNANGWNGNLLKSIQPVMGICPQGWHLPSSNTTGEFNTLFTAAGSPRTGFFQPGGNFKSLHSGYCDNSGSLNGHGSYGIFWSSTEVNSENAYNLDFYGGNNVYPSSNTDKSLGNTVRCIKN